MADLRTPYLGFNLTCPLVAAASPMTGKLDAVRALEDAGVGAITLPSLFEEQIEHEELAMRQLMAFGADAFGEATSGYFPSVAPVADSLNGHSASPSYAYGNSADDYLNHIRTTKETVSVPVIASMNGTTDGGWLDYARLIERAGADALELNIYYIAADPAVSGVEVEQRFIDVVRAVRQVVSIPLAVKIPPFFSAPAHMIRSLHRAGAQSVVLFNRFVQPDIDLGALEVRPDLKLSSSEELRLTLRWMAILFGKVGCQLAATTGAHTADDVLKLLLAGANVVTFASALLRHGPSHVRSVRYELVRWLQEREYGSIDELRGSLSQMNSPDPVAFERANYMKALLNFSSPYRRAP